MVWFMANWQMLAVAIMAVAEVIAMFIPGAQGTVKTIVTALVSLGAKDPGVGK